MLGVDYAPAAVDLARSWAEKRGLAEAHFEVADVLDAAFVDRFRGAVDLLLDKGTYDAISLAPSPALRRAFLGMAAEVLRPGTGRLLITSCNWTQEELVDAFSSGEHAAARGRSSWTPSAADVAETGGDADGVRGAAQWG